MANSVKQSHRAIQRGPSLYSIEAGILPKALTIDEHDEGNP